MSEAELRKAVDQAVAAVSMWRQNVAGISTSIDQAHATIAAANAVREQHALAASLNDPTATSALRKARAEHAEAAQALHDLQIALDGAQLRLTEALRDEVSARQALNRHIAEIAMRERVKVAAKLDAVFAEMANFYAQYVNLGNEIANLDVLPRSYAGVADHEGLRGARRVRAAMPRFTWQLFPGALHDELKSEPLATTEARHFGLNVKAVGETVVEFVKPKPAVAEGSR